MVPSGSPWLILSLSGSVKVSFWVYLGQLRCPFSFFWFALGCFGSLWFVLVRFGSLWVVLDRFSSFHVFFWFVLTHFKSFGLVLGLLS